MKVIFWYVDFSNLMKSIIGTHKMSLLLVHIKSMGKELKVMFNFSCNEGPNI